VRMFVHPEQTTRESYATRFSEVTITLEDGRTMVHRVDQAKGAPRNPLTDAELEVKFRDAAGRVLPKDRVEALRSAYVSVLKDAEFLKETEKSGMVIRSQAGAELEKSVKEVAQTPQTVIAKTAQILKWK